MPSPQDSMLWVHSMRLLQLSGSELHHERGETKLRSQPPEFVRLSGQVFYVRSQCYRLKKVRRLTILDTDSSGSPLGHSPNRASSVYGLLNEPEPSHIFGQVLGTSGPFIMQSPEPYAGRSRPPALQGTSQAPLRGRSSISLQDGSIAAPTDAEHSVSGVTFTRFQRPPKGLVEPNLCELIDRRASMTYFDTYCRTVLRWFVFTANCVSVTEIEWIYQLWPIPDFIKSAHEAIWQHYDRAIDHPMNVGMRTILAALLALGAHFARNFEDSENLYRAARASFLDVVELGTLDSVQLAMQMAVLEINTSRSKSVWSTLAIAVRISHSLVCYCQEMCQTTDIISVRQNLHRKPALAGKTPQEQLRRCQLWYNSFVHDCWLSVSSGRPPLATEGDCDLDAPWLLPTAKGSISPHKLVSSPIFGYRVRVSCLWTRSGSTFLFRDPLN